MILTPMVLVLPSLEMMTSSFRIRCDSNTTTRDAIRKKRQFSYIFSYPPNRNRIAVSRIQIYCEVMCEACLVQVFNIRAMVKIIQDTIAIKISDARIANWVFWKKHNNNNHSSIQVYSLKSRQNGVALEWMNIGPSFSLFRLICLLLLTASHSKFD